MFDTISESVAAYDDMLNEVYTWSDVGGINFAPSDILRDLDPIAYKCGWLEYMDALEIDIDALEDDYAFSRDRL